MENKKKKIVLICTLIFLAAAGATYGAIKFLKNDDKKKPDEVENNISITLEVKLSSTSPEEIHFINNLGNLRLLENELGNIVVYGHDNKYLSVTYSDSTPEEISFIQYGVSVSSFAVSGDDNNYLSVDEDDLDLVFDTLIIDETNNNKNWFNAANLAGEVILSETLLNHSVSFETLKTTLVNTKITIELDAEEIYQD